MPLNEAGGYRRSNLTKEQKREAEAAIYGIPTQKAMEQFSPEQIEQMRAMLAAHDAQTQRQGIKEFDLNAPPKVPYVFQEFPKLVYHHESRVHKAVHNKQHETQALDAGYRRDPFPADPPAEVELDEADQAEAARLDKIARKKRQPAAE